MSHTDEVTTKEVDGPSWLVVLAGPRNETADAMEIRYFQDPAMTPRKHVAAHYLNSRIKSSSFLTKTTV